MFEYIDQAAFNFDEVQTLRREAEGGRNEELVSCKGGVPRRVGWVRCGWWGIPSPLPEQGAGPCGFLPLPYGGNLFLLLSPWSGILSILQFL